MPDGMPVMFDLQIEAEIWAVRCLGKDNPPSVRSHPLADEKSIPCRCMMPSKESGRIPMILMMRRVKAAIGQQTALYGLIADLYLSLI